MTFTNASVTAALDRAGLLGRAPVVDVSVDSTRVTVLSQIIRLRISYAGETAGAPNTLIVKTSHPDRLDAGWVGGR